MSAYLTAKQFAIASKTKEGQKLIKDLPNISQNQAETRFEDEVLSHGGAFKPTTPEPAKQDKPQEEQEQGKEAPKAPEQPVKPTAPEKPQEGANDAILKQVYDIIAPIAKKQGW